MSPFERVTAMKHNLIPTSFNRAFLRYVSAEEISNLGSSSPFFLHPLLHTCFLLTPVLQKTQSNQPINAEHIEGSDDAFHDRLCAALMLSDRSCPRCDAPALAQITLMTRVPPLFSLGWVARGRMSISPRR